MNHCSHRVPIFTWYVPSSKRSISFNVMFGSSRLSKVLFLNDCHHKNTCLQKCAQDGQRVKSNTDIKRILHSEASGFMQSQYKSICLTVKQILNQESVCNIMTSAAPSRWLCYSWPWQIEKIQPQMQRLVDYLYTKSSTKPPFAEAENCNHFVFTCVLSDNYRKNRLW